MEDNEKDLIERADKRVKFITTVASLALTALGVGFVAVTIFAGVNLDSEIDRLGELETELRKEIRIALGQVAEEPDVILLSDIDKPLEGQTLTAQVLEPTREGYKIRVVFPVIFKNQGKGGSEPLFAKVYSTKNLPFGGRSSDERDFAYEIFFPPDKLPFKSAIFPAGASASFNVGFNIKQYNESLERYPMLMKIYFGGEAPNQARFLIKIPKQETN